MSIEDSAKEIEEYVEKSRQAGVLDQLLVEVLANFGNDYDAVAASFYLAYQTVTGEGTGGAKIMRVRLQ